MTFHRFSELHPACVQTIVGFLRDESGVTALEYGLAGALIFAGCLLALDARGDTVHRSFEALVASVTRAV